TEKRASKRAGTEAQSFNDFYGAWLWARVSSSLCTLPLKFAGLLKPQAHCPRAERFASRSVFCE
ncbi:MAG TPA: hypothetical protein VI585_28395, partial [Candidatus Binatia bacterium]